MSLVVLLLYVIHLIQKLLLNQLFLMIVAFLIHYLMTFLFLLCFCLRFLYLFAGYQCINILCITSEPIIVEAISNDKIIRNIHGSVADWDSHLESLGLNQKWADADTGRIVTLESFKHVSHGDTRVYDVLHDDNITACDILGQTNYLAYLARRLHALITCQLDEAHLTRQVHLAKQICCEDKWTVEHGHEDRLSSWEIAVDFCGHTGHLMRYRLGRYWHLESLVLNLNLFHLLVFLAFAVAKLGKIFCFTQGLPYFCSKFNVFI